MGRSSISLSIVSVLIVLSVLWKPAFSEDKCSLGCKGSPTGASFLSGHKYNYAVQGVVSIYLTGADKQETSVKLLGQVTVTSLGNCGYILRVTNLVISGPDSKNHKISGIEKPVRFTLQDGFVASEICAEEGDTRRSLNIKRAIISLLQSGQKSSTEIDIFGACPTDASSSKEGGSVLVHRSRDLSRCAHREHGKNDLITAVYNPQAEIKNTQVLQSTLNVESKLNNGIPEKVSAMEEYLYKPFSVGENGARAKVQTKLTLTGQSAGADAGQFTQLRTIIFENPHGANNEGSNYQTALNTVKETAKSVSTEASFQSASNFAQLVRVLRSTNKDDFIKIYNAVKGNNLEKRVFLDGLIRAGTGSSIETAIQLLKTKELSPIEQRLVYLSFGNARHITNEALKAAASLLDTQHLPKEVYLGVGALAGAYCRSHPCHGGESEGITTLSQKFIAKLQNCKPKNKVDEDYVVAVLKGIRNIRHLENGVVDKVVHCATDNTVKARLRVAALEAFQADPCSAKIKKAGLDLMKNRQLDSEIRIKAYLAVIDCPCSKSATEIKNLLENEPVHQVGRFITSSLRYIRASTDSDKRNAREHYGQIRTPNKFNIDDRKYSFYREASYSFDAFGIGGNIEETVIYSQDSFLPKSASVNVTAEVFGHNVNIFEIGGRQGNLDRVIEHFAGPKGVFRTKSPQEIYDAIKEKFMASEEKFAGKLRGRRSIGTDIDSYDKKIKTESAPFNNELDLDIYVKLFGTDAVFLSLGDDKGFDFNKIVDQLAQYIETGINSAKKFHQEVRAHVLFLDAELAYATSTGLPLKLNLVGAATGRFEVSTNVDIRQILRDPDNAKVDIKLVPSTDIEISGIFLVDADAIATGLKVITNLHTSTGGHVIAKILENGQGFDLQLGLPIEKQEIITASNDLVFFTSEKGQKEKQTKIKVEAERKEYTGCFDQLAGVIGLTLCGDVSVPFTVSGPEAQSSLQSFFARYPLTGSARVKLHLEKNDLKGYHVKGIFRVDQPGKKSFELLLEAEGSKNRKTAVSGELVNTDEEKTVLISLESPIKTLYGQISLITKSNEYAALVKAKMDAETYYARAGFNIQGNEARSVFRPIAEYEMPGGQGKKSLKIDGQIIKEVKGAGLTKYTLEGIKVNMPNMEVVDVNGHFAMAPRGFDTEIKAKKGEHNLFLIANANEHDLKVEFQNTLNPFVNFKANIHSEIEKENIRNELDLYYGGDLKDQEARVTFNQLLKYHKNSPEDFGLITKNKLHIHAVPILAKFDAEIDPKKVDIEIEGQYAEKKGKFDLEARTFIKKEGDYSVKLDASINNKGFEAFAKRDIVSTDKSNLENYIVIKNIGKYELSGVVLHKIRDNDINVGAIGHLKVTASGKKEDIKFDIGAIETATLYSSHAKVSRSDVELLDFLLKLNRGANPTGQLKLNLRDTISANGQYKVSENDGKGNGAIIIDFKKSGKKIKGDVKFVVKDPVYNADVDLYLNFEKDNADKIHLSTNTKRTDKQFDTKNKIEYSGKKFEINAHRDGLLRLEGKLNGKIEIVLPNERYLAFKLDRELSVNDDVYNGHGEISIVDAPKRGEQESTLSYKGKIIDSNFDKHRVNYEGLLQIKLKDGRNLENTFYFKNLPESGEKAKLDFKTDVTGNLIPNPASLSINSEYTDSDDLTIDGTEKYRIKGSYGNDIGFELEGDDDYKLLEKGDKKFQEDYTLNIRLPIEKFKNIKIVSNTLFIHPENKDVAIEYSVSESIQLNSDLYKVDASGKFGEHNGFGKIKVQVPHTDPFSFDGSYKADLEGDKKSGGFDVKATYGKGKSASVSVDASTEGHDCSISVKANTPQAEKLKKLEIDVHTKKKTTEKVRVPQRPSPETYSNAITIDADGRIYKSDATFVYSKSQPLIDIKYSSPSTDKPSRLYVKGNALSSTHGKLELKIENIRDLSLDAVSEGSIQKDNVALKLQANSEKLGMKNYKVDISSKDAGSGKRLEFFATNDNQNVLSGSTSFISKQEGPKTIIEGSGSIKVKDEQKSATFKYIRTILTEGTEQGIETFMNVAIGERSYVAESRVTNLEYKTSYVYCEEKKQCAHAELHSKVNAQKAGVFQHTVNIGLDLRKLGFAPEFGLQMNNEVSERRLPQYTLDVHMNKEEKKYHIHVYSQPEHGRFPAGITITLPQRVLTLESLISYPTDKGLPFPIKGEVSLNLDKNKPNQKAAVRCLIDVTGSEKQHAVAAEFGLTHPKLGKEAVLKFRGNLQRPAENSIKIESAASISHSTVGGDRESKLLFEASPVHIKINIETPIVKIIDLDGSATIKDNIQQGDLKFSLLQGKEVVVHAVAKDFQYFELSSGYSEEGERKLAITGHIEPEKRIDISADIVFPNEKKNIFHAALFVQDNLVKSDYGASKDNINHFVNALKSDLQTLEGRVKQLGEKSNSEFKNIVNRLEPTFKELEQSYREQIDKLVQELSNDQVLKEISHALDEVVKFVASFVKDILEVTKPLIDNIIKTVTETSKKIYELYEKDIAPQIAQLYRNLSAIFNQYLDGLIDVIAHFTAIITDFVDKHKPELQELTNTIAEIFKDLTRLIVAQLKDFRMNASQVFADMTQQIKDMPIIANIKERIKELAVPEQVLGLLLEAHQTIRMVLPTEETQALADAISNYVQKKLRQEKIDDNAELRVIYEKFAVALTSVIQHIRQQLNQFGVVPNAFGLNALPFLSGPSGNVQPTFGGLPAFNFINMLNVYVPEPIKLFSTYRPRSVNPLDEIPAKLRGIVVNGQHIFSFDGRHLTFPGTCRYVLAHDFADRNFTLALNLQNGQPKGLILEDKSGAVVELKDNGQVAVNGAVHGFPVIEKDSFAFRAPNGLIGLGTSYGLMAFCTSELQVCYIEVSGFYLGKLRGLLGDGNNEPFDDFRLPNGKIVNSEAEFGNSQKMSSSCAAVKTPEHSAHQHHATMPPACEQVFGGSSPLRPLSIVLDVSPFRQACIHAVTANSANALQEACDLARGYAALAATGLLPVILPSDCVQCKDTDKPRSIGDSYELTLPAKQADLVVVFDTTKSNEKNFKDLLVPLVGQVIDGLKAKKIDDIKVYLVGISSKMPYPILYDSDLKLKNAKVTFTDESRYKKFPELITGNQKFDDHYANLAILANKIRIRLGITNIDFAYTSIYDLPLRPGALKHTIGLVGEQCYASDPILTLIQSFLASIAFEENAYSHSLVTVTPDLKIGAGQNAAQVVGFNEDSVFILGDKKKGKDTSAMRETLETEDDGCIDFVEGSDGLIFSSTNFVALNGGQQKQFLHTASAAILDRILGSTFVQDCTCTYVDPFNARSVCYNKEKKEVARRRK